MPTDKQANVIDHVLFATHDYPCMARGCGEKAILRMNEGVFGPCAKHEGILVVEFVKLSAVAHVAMEAQETPNCKDGDPMTTSRMKQVGPCQWIVDKSPVEPEPVADAELLNMLTDAGVALARQQKRIDELVESNQAVLEEKRNLGAMYDRHPFKGMTKDERRVTLMFIAKLMGEGRSEHGDLDMATDKRDSHALLREALDEVLDSVCYMLMGLRKLEIEQ